MRLRVPMLLLAIGLLAGCAGQSSSESPVAVASALRSRVAVDPQICQNRIDCSLKSARTLLFIYDYAYLSGLRPERQGNLIFIPGEAGPGRWPVIRIHLAAPEGGHFRFEGACLLRQCRYSGGELLTVYRRYLIGEPCVLPGDPQRNCRVEP